MRKFNLVGLMVMGLLMISAAPRIATAEESQVMNPTPAAGEVISVKAKGLVCDFCARALEKLFGRREEVSSISVDLTSKLITIQLKEGQSMDDATVEKLVTDSGYNIESIERS